jgi:hypothetical protein
VNDEPGDNTRGEGANDNTERMDKKAEKRTDLERRKDERTNLDSGSNCEVMCNTVFSCSSPHLCARRASLR